MLKQDIKNEFIKLTGMAAAIKGSIDTDSGIVDKILTESLYDNTIGSPPREMLMNAIDAMFQAGKGGEPVIIKVPNDLDHDFYIKDSGIGLTPDEVKYLFQTLGASKKRKNGENGEMAMKHLTGEFGLGSKAFFAYTDAGWVIAAKDGIQETFFLSYDGDGNRVCIPVENSRVPAPSDWQNGVCVGYAIKPQDFNRFYDEIEEVLRWVDYPVTILGRPTEIKKPTPVLKGIGWALYPSHFSQNSIRQHYVRMGRIVYPLNVSRLGEINPNIRTILTSMGLVLDVDNKTVDVVANREALKYSEKTINALLSRLTAMAQEMTLQVVEISQALERGDWATRVAAYANFDKGLFWVKSVATKFAIEFLGVEEKETKVLTYGLLASAKRLPNWAGDGNRLYSLWSARKVYFNEAGEETLTPSIGQTPELVAVDPGVGIVYEPVRLHVCTKETSGRRGRGKARFVMYEVVAGIRSGAAESEGNYPVAYKGPVALVLDDEKHTKEKVKELASLAKYSSVFVLSTPKGTPRSALEPYAQRLSNEMGGWEILKSSEMGIPETVLEARERRNQSRLNAASVIKEEPVSLLVWDSEKNELVSEYLSMHQVLDRLHPMPEEDENGVLQEKEPTLTHYPLILPYRFSKGEVVLPGDSRESPNTVSLDRFKHWFSQVVSVGSDLFPEQAKCIMLIQPKAIKAGKLIKDGQFQYFADAFRKLVDIPAMKARVAELAAGLPSVIPFPPGYQYADYWETNLRETNLIKRLFGSYKDSLERDENGTALVETEKSRKFLQAAQTLATFDEFKELPAMLASIKYSVTESHALTIVRNVKELLPLRASDFDALFGSEQLAEVVAGISLPIHAEHEFTRIASIARLDRTLNNCDLFRNIWRDENGVELSVKYFLAIYSIYQESLIQEQDTKKAA